MRARRPRVGASGDARVEWDDLLELVGRERSVWLATVRRDGTPHVTPVWAVVVDGAPWFWTSPESTKGRNLDRLPSCALHAEDGDLVATLDGDAHRVESTDVRAVYASTYGNAPETPGFWRVEIRSGRAWRRHGGDVQLGLTIFER